MASIYLGTQMDAGNIKWRPKVTPQPADRLLVLEYRGDPSGLQGLDLVNNHWQVDAARLRAAYPLFAQDWVPAAGTWPASVQMVGSGAVVSVQF
jgi:hypothetical protein